MAACQSDELMAEANGQTDADVADVRPLVEHTVSVAINGSAGNAASQTATRVGYTPVGDGLQLSWETSEALGVYIHRTNDSYVYAGKMTSNGAAGGGVRHFSGTVSAKSAGETYVYVHPFIGGEAQGNTARGTINLSTQSAALGSTAHLTQLIPLIWTEGSPFPSNQGYAIHLSLAFNEDPGNITRVTFQTMPEVGTTDIFPTAFDASTMHGGNTKNTAITLNVTSGTATRHGSVWTADAYLACTNADVNVFRTKFNVKVEAANGTYYNEYRSFPGQESATSQTLPMLTNGKCYNLGTVMSKDYAYTVISNRYKVNSLLGMWNEFGKSTDPLNLIVYQGGEAPMPGAGVLPQQLADNKSKILERYISQKESNGTPNWLGAGAGTLYDVTATANHGNYKQDNVTINNIEITKPTEVFVTFISEFGWNENLLGYYHYNGDAPESSFAVNKMLIFPNFSKPNHQPFNLGGTGSGNATASVNIGTPEQAPLREFETVKLLYTDAQGYTSTTFPAGTTIGFMMMIDTEAQEQIPNAGYNLLKWSQWRLFTNTTWNTENTRANGAAADWPLIPGYAKWNYFCSGDVCSDDSGTPIPGLAIYGVKDTGNNDANTAYGAMIFMVSTSNPSAMQTYNKAYFNLATGSLVIAK